VLDVFVLTSREQARAGSGAQRRAHRGVAKVEQDAPVAEGAGVEVAGDVENDAARDGGAG
jgi:hypothetical protein